MSGNIDPTLSRQIVRAIRGSTLDAPSAADALREAGGIPLPVQTFKHANRQPILISFKFTSPVTPEDELVYTVPEGKVLQVFGIFALTTATSTTFMRDGIADGGNEMFCFGSSGIDLAWSPDYPVTFLEGVRFDATDQDGSKVYRGNIVGYLEDKESASPSLFAFYDSS